MTTDEGRLPLTSPERRVASCEAAWYLDCEARLDELALLCTLVDCCLSLPSELVLPRASLLFSFLVLV